MKRELNVQGIMTRARYRRCGALLASVSLRTPSWAPGTGDVTGNQEAGVMLVCASRMCCRELVQVKQAAVASVARIVSLLVTDARPGWRRHIRRAVNVTMPSALIVRPATSTGTLQQTAKSASSAPMLRHGITSNSCT